MRIKLVNISKELNIAIKDLQKISESDIFSKVNTLNITDDNFLPAILYIAFNFHKTIVINNLTDAIIFPFYEQLFNEFYRDVRLIVEKNKTKVMEDYEKQAKSDYYRKKYSDLAIKKITDFYPDVIKKAQDLGFTKDEILQQLLICCRNTKLDSKQAMEYLIKIFHENYINKLKNNLGDNYKEYFDKTKGIDSILLDRVMKGQNFNTILMQVYNDNKFVDPITLNTIYYLFYQIVWKCSFLGGLIIKNLMNKILPYIMKNEGLENITKYTKNKIITNPNWIPDDTDVDIMMKENFEFFEKTGVNKYINEVCGKVGGKRKRYILRR